MICYCNVCCARWAHSPSSVIVVTVYGEASVGASHSATPLVLSLLTEELLDKETSPESWLLGGENTAHKQTHKAVTCLLTHLKNPTHENAYIVK